MAGPVLYRIVASDSPTWEDFLSDRARGARPPHAPDMRRVWDGLSAFATLTQARNKARQYPWLGRFVSRLVLPEAGSAIRWERTFLKCRPSHAVGLAPGTSWRA